MKFYTKKTKDMSDKDKQSIVTLFNELLLSEYSKLNTDKKYSDEIISQLIKKIIRQIIRSDSPKKPEVKSHIIRL